MSLPRKGIPQPPLHPLLLLPTPRPPLSLPLRGAGRLGRKVIHNARYALDLLDLRDHVNENLEGDILAWHRGFALAIAKTGGCVRVRDGERRQRGTERDREGGGREERESERVTETDIHSQTHTQRINASGSA